MASSPPSRPEAELLSLPSASESQLSSLVYDLSNQANAAMENMLKMINEIDQNSSEVQDEIGKCRDFALEKKKTLDQEKEHFQKAAYAVINILNNHDIS